MITYKFKIKVNKDKKDTQIHIIISYIFPMAELKKRLDGGRGRKKVGTTEYVKKICFTHL